MKSIVDNQRYICAGIGALEFAHDADGLIADIVDAADDLNPAGIVLLAETLQVGVEPRLSAVQRFQDRNEGTSR